MHKKIYSSKISEFNFCTTDLQFVYERLTSDDSIKNKVKKAKGITMWTSIENTNCERFCHSLDDLIPGRKILSISKISQFKKKLDIFPP